MLQPSARLHAPSVGNIFHEFVPAAHTSGTPALLIHGFTVRGDMFNPVKDRLATQHPLLIPDLRGGGRSARLPGPATLDEHVADLLHLLEQHDLLEVHLVGYSLGGTIAQEFLFRYPERVKSLTLACTWAHKQASIMEWSQVYAIPAAIHTMGGKKLGKMLTPTVMREFYGFYDQAVYEWYHHVFNSYTDERLLESAHEIFRFDSRRQLPRVQHPTLVIGGTNDKVVPPYHSRELAKLIPNARLEILEGGGHGLIFTHSGQLADLLLSHWAKADIR